jgi:NAD(P)-dependent dehydrogenase (short-subunit alcohol dehydrogenase family)
MGLVEGKVALVTGAGSGIGKATALAFAAEGASAVVACDINAAAADETRQLVEDGGCASLSFAADIADAEGVRALVDATVNAFGRIDCAHNNAGVVGPITTMDEYPEDEWRRVIDVNATGTFLCMKYELRVMLTQRSGAIVNTASGNGLKGASHLSAYIASKHAVIGMTKAAAYEYGRLGIRVNAVCPGSTRTPPLLAYLDDPNAEKQAVSSVPMGRLAEPPEIAAAVVWLSSDSASFVCGEALRVDGGWAS